jgi:hypothetical protein
MRRRRDNDRHRVTVAQERIYVGVVRHAVRRADFRRTLGALVMEADETNPFQRTQETYVMKT